VARGVVLDWTLGDRLRKARDHAGLDQKDMAKAFGVTAKTISNREHGRGSPRGDPGELCEEWGKLTGVSPQWIAFGKSS
jgi:transcriptional regulator with XRE-family HTH domain